jgi:pathogen-inducible salicylic acid glucosyltransferase
MASRSSDQSVVHVLLLPFPTQGHINPLLQFGKRLAGRSGVRCTLAATRFVINSTKPTPSSVHVAAISDGCDERGPDELGGMGVPYFERIESAGSETLDELLRSESELGRPVQVVVYDAFAPWAQRVARRRGAASAAFLTQPCAVDILYAHAWAGRVPPPPLRPEEVRDLPGLSTQLEVGDMPTFLVDIRYPPCFRELLLNQFLGLDTADHVLVLRPGAAGSGLLGVYVESQDGGADRPVGVPRQPPAGRRVLRHPPARPNGGRKQGVAGRPTGAVRSVRLLR